MTTPIKYGNDAVVYVDENSIPSREDGPAVEWEGVGGMWYKSGKLHRTDGPALVLQPSLEEGKPEYLTVPVVEWWIEGKQLNPAIIKKSFANPAEPTDDEIVIFKMTVIPNTPVTELYKGRY